MLISKHIRALAKELIPPLVMRGVRRAIRRVTPGTSVTEDLAEIHFEGDHFNWEEALQVSDGYDNSVILKQVRESTAKVRDGVAVAERDGVTFDTPQWNFPLLACLGRIAAQYAGRLNVLDFGGSLGGTYLQCRDFFAGSVSFRWNIVEQEHFVACGQREFASDELQFFRTIEECLSKGPIDVVLLSSVVQYVEDPWELLGRVVSLGTDFILIDRTALIDADHDVLTVQHVPEWIYGTKITFPAWFLGREKLARIMATRFRKTLEFPGADGVWNLDRYRATFTGQLWHSL